MDQSRRNKKGTFPSPNINCIERKRQEKETQTHMHAQKKKGENTESK